MQIVANAKTLPMLKGYYDVVEDRVKVVAEGESIPLGESTLKFYMTPMVHWPETMVTWFEEEGTIFSGDAFGTFGTVPEEIVDKDDTFEQYEDEMVRYYSNIVGKYGTPVQAVGRVHSPGLQSNGGYQTKFRSAAAAESSSVCRCPFHPK